ncbi:MAG: universal stress protein [Bacteroidetes bacterium]|nr:universal stress protein [Bacteroidota bacterium]
METKKPKETKYNNIILVPTDFSEVCENAIDQGVELAQYLNYKVCILHVIDKQTEATLKKEKLTPDTIDEKLKSYKDLYEQKYNVEIGIMSRKGTIFKVIGKVASELKANLMVLGTHGKQGIQHLFGSHALRVVLDSPCPVVVVQKRTFGEGYKEIVFPISNELESRQAIDWLVLISRLFNSKIILYQSLESDPALNSRLKIISQQIGSYLKIEKVNFEVIIAEQTKNFSSQVISYAVNNKSNLIMIMTMPGGDMPGFSFSAWDEHMMFNEAEIPVMCINPVDLGNYYYDWMMRT